MENSVTIQINGVSVLTPKGTPVIDAAHDAGFCIPNLCHLRSGDALGACRMCMVELEERGKTKITASCTLEAKEGMVIRTHTETLQRLRRNIAELILAEAPNSRAVQDMAVRVGLKNVRYPFRNNDCILCGKCVRVCDVVLHSESLGFVGRGINRHVSLPFGDRNLCLHCNECLSVCPMSITPCEGPMLEGHMCGKCESTMSIAEGNEDACFWCEMGRGFMCSRWQTVSEGTFS